MEVLSALSYSFMFLITLSLSEDIECDYHCQDGPTVNSTDCHVVVGCDLSFPNISFSYASIFVLRLDLNFTELATDDADHQTPFLYSGTFRWYEDHTYDRYLFQVEYLLRNSSGEFYVFSFLIRDIQPGDAGTYHVNLTEIDYYDGTDGPILLQHTYRIFVYQPPTPLVCQRPSSSPSGSYHVTISCSITNGFPPINLEMIEPEGCAFQKHYTDENGIQDLSIYVMSCDQNSTVGCIATQESLEFLSTSQYSDRCEFNISESNPGLSSSPSYHVAISCLITDGLLPVIRTQPLDASVLMNSWSPFLHHSILTDVNLTFSRTDQG
ncbi:uncharacterized protein [Apostichopus japonicus]|uniref:uncharacterized protein isoform X2 n=1 Tax=Stichopus japonicus TaxID=307972 RepID=UPI003AB21B82